MAREPPVQAGGLTAEATFLIGWKGGHTVRWASARQELFFLSVQGRKAINSCIPSSLTISHRNGVIWSADCWSREITTDLSECRLQYACWLPAHEMMVDSPDVC
ncbi:unnamed protein product [Urochloa humidicola]